jgi:hypothetical protein
MELYTYFKIDYDKNPYKYYINVQTINLIVNFKNNIYL